jgi:hypothetical protein
MVVPYSVRVGTFQAGTVRPWSGKAIAPSGFTRNLDVTADGTRVIATVVAETRELPNHARLVVNFLDEVRRRVGR